MTNRSGGKSSVAANLTVLPGGVDLAEREAMKVPMRARIILVPITEGTLVHDQRLGPPAVHGDSFMWMLAESDLEGADPPLILPSIEN
jgi:hypothetical protein